MPSGRFAADGAWLAVQVMAHNLDRWTARIGLGGYEPHDSDFKDVSALCERFGIDYPEEYAHLKKPDL